MVLVARRAAAALALAAVGPRRGRPGCPQAGAVAHRPDAGRVCARHIPTGWTVGAAAVARAGLAG
jgi:hypothetical protein